MYQLVALAEVDRRVHGLNKLKDDVRQRLSEWFWATTFSAYFGGMPSNKIREAVDHLEHIARGQRAGLPIDMERNCLPLSTHNFKAVRVRGRALKFLTLLRCQDERDRRAAQLGLVGPNAVLTLDRCLQGNRPGARILGDIGVRQRVRDALQAPDEHKELLAEHLITPKAAALFVAKDWKGFSEEREGDIDTWESSILATMGLKLAIPEPTD